jgi:hypothetical protein
MAPTEAGWHCPQCGSAIVELSSVGARAGAFAQPSEMTDVSAAHSGRR